MLYFCHSAQFVEYNQYIFNLGLVNWVDVLLGLAMIWGYFTGQKSTFIAEIFKLLGVFLATVIALHYYVPFSIILAKALLLPVAIQEAFSFVLLITVIILFFYFLREAWQLILKIEGVLFLDKWGSLVLSLVRTFYLCGLILIALLLFKDGFFAQGAKRSFSYHLMGKTSLGVYEWSFKNLISKIAPNEKINKQVFKLVDQKAKR